MPEDNREFFPEVEERARREEVRPFSHDEMLRCEECLRANPPTRTNCLYCGAHLPVTEAAAAQRKLVLRQPEKWEDGFSVVLLKATSVTEETTGEVSRLLHLERAEARRIMEATEPLPLVRVATREQASFISERLGAHGLRLLIVSDGELVTGEPNQRRVRAMALESDALVLYQAGSGEQWRANWPELLLFVTGRVVRRRVEVEERRRRGASEMVEATETSADVLLLDIYTRARDGGWRIASDSFDFSCLGERKGLVAAQNFVRLIEALSERAPHAEHDDSYQRMRQALGPIWPPEEHTEARGLRRERPGRFNTEAVMTSDNEAQFTRYSRLRHYLKLGQSDSHIV